MHELAVCQSLLRQVEEIARRDNARRVELIRLRIGPLSGVVGELLEQAFSLTGDDPIIAVHLGDAHLALDQAEKALHYFRKALELEPDLEKDRKRIEEKVKKLKNRN